MSEHQQRPLVRATFRCLQEDLAQEVGPDALRDALRTVVADMAADPTYLLPCPLVDAEHAVLDKANMVAADDAAPRERIEVLTDRYVIKVKTGDRRAALWHDDQDTWWLLAAGRRKNDTAGDFYREIERFSRDATPIAPTDIDFRYQRLEEAYEAECAPNVPRKLRSWALYSPPRGRLHRWSRPKCSARSCRSRSSRTRTGWRCWR